MKIQKEIYKNMSWPNRKCPDKQTDLRNNLMRISLFQSFSYQSQMSLIITEMQPLVFCQCLGDKWAHWTESRVFGSQTPYCK